MDRRAELEAKLLENPRDPEARLVYADLLQSQGDPRGELIVLQHRGKHADAEAYLQQHRDALLGPLARFDKRFDHDGSPAFTWHLGFIRSAQIGYDSNVMDDESTADLVVAALLQHPSAMLLEELTITMNMLDDGMYFDPVVKAIAAHGAPALRTLRLGEFQHTGPGGVDNGYDYEISWSSLGDASGMWKVLPRLERLRIQLGLGGTSANGDEDSIGTFDLPKLRELEVVTGGMSEACLRSFADAKLPAAEHVDLWLGSSNYGAGGSVAELAPLLAGAHVPKLRHLGLMNCEWTDSVCRALATSAILPRLAELDLRYGTMTDAGARALARARLDHLEELDVTDNHLTDAGIAALRARCNEVISDEQKPADDEDRYVSLGE